MGNGSLEYRTSQRTGQAAFAASSVSKGPLRSSTTPSELFEVKPFLHIPHEVALPENVCAFLLISPGRFYLGIAIAENSQAVKVTQLTPADIDPLHGAAISVTGGLACGTAR
jgi:hypothetical protein